MGKLQQIKKQIAELLMEFAVVKTDKGVLEYEGEELKEGVVVKIVNEDGTTEIPSGEFITEDNKKLIVESGEIKSIEEIEVEQVEVVEPVEPVKEEEKPEEVVEPVKEEEKPEEEKPEEETVDAVAELKDRVAELETIVNGLMAEIENLKTANEGFEEKFSKISLAKPAVEEFEQVNKVKKTGNAKLDKFLAGCK